MKQTRGYFLTVLNNLCDNKKCFRKILQIVKWCGFKKVQKVMKWEFWEFLLRQILINLERGLSMPKENKEVFWQSNSLLKLLTSSPNSDQIFKKHSKDHNRKKRRVVQEHFHMYILETWSKMLDVMLTFCIPCKLVSGFWWVAVTYYLTDQTLDRKVTLKIFDGTML